MRVIASKFIPGNIDFEQFHEKVEQEGKIISLPRQSIARDVKFTEREKLEQEEGDEEAAGTKRSFFFVTAYGGCAFATFYTHFARFLSLYIITTCSSASSLHGQFVRVRCLPARLASSSLTSGSKRNPPLIPFFPPSILLVLAALVASGRSSCASSCTRHPYANERPRGTHACRGTSS